MSTCQLCGSQVVWHENLRCYVSEITGKRHGYNLCLIKIPRWELSKEARIMCVRKPDAIAAEIVRRCLEAGRDIEKIKPTIEGDYIILR